MEKKQIIANLYDIADGLRAYALSLENQAKALKSGGNDQAAQRKAYNSLKGVFSLVTPTAGKIWQALGGVLNTTWMD